MPANIRYFTGFDTQFFHSPTRPWFLVIPYNKKPIAVIPEIGKTLMEMTWVEDIRTWDSPNPSDDGISLVASKIKKLGNRFGRVSAEDLHLSDEYMRGGIIEAKEQLLMQSYTKQMVSFLFFQQI